MNKRLLTLLFVLICQLSKATPEIYSVRRQANLFLPSFSWTIVDGQFAALSSPPFFDKGTELLVKLGIDEDVSYGYIPAFTYSVDVKITPFNNSNVAQPFETATLEVSYAPGGTSLETNLHYYIKKSNFHKYLIEVEPNFLVTPANVYIESELKIDRYYEISTATPVVGSNYVYYDVNTNQEYVVNNVNTLPLPGVGELEVWWN